MDVLSKLIQEPNFTAHIDRDYWESLLLGIPDGRPTATSVRMNVPTPKSLKFPDRFFEVHKDRLFDGIMKYPPGTIFSFILKESWDFTMSTGLSYKVDVKSVETEKGVHIIPLGPQDVKTAEEWEERYKGIPDSELTS